MVKIITDSTAGLPPEVARNLGITVIPQIIHFGNDSYMEGVDLDSAGFMLRLKKSRELPKTAAPPPELFVKEFNRLIPLGGSILCIHPTADASGTVRSALSAKAEFPGADIRVIDTRAIGSPLATMVTLAADWASTAHDANTIEQRLRLMIPCCHIYFLVATLEYLAKGGRIGGAAALLGSVLQIKPILTLRDGKVELLERERTHRRALARLKELVFEKIAPGPSGYLSIMHASVPSQALELATDLRIHLNLAEVPILDVPPAIVVHGGPGMLAVAFFSKQ